MNYDQIRHIDAIARAKFTYRPDGQFDTWRSHAEDVLAGRAWEGDCDDLVSTVMELLGNNGLALAERYRLEVCMNGGPAAFNHLVGCVTDDEGRFWIVGDTEGAAYEAQHMLHRPYSYNRLSEITDGKPIVRSGVPWK